MWLALGIFSALVFAIAAFQSVILSKRGNPLARKWRLMAVIALMWVIVGFTNSARQ